MAGAELDLGAEISRHPHSGAGPRDWVLFALTAGRWGRSESYVLFERGIERSSRAGVERFRWEDITALASIEAPGANQWKYDLWAGEEELSISSRSHAGVGSGTGEFLRDKTHAVLWPQCLKGAQSGGVVRLGTLQIDRTKLWTSTVEVPFDGLEDVVQDGPDLVFTDRNGTVTRIPAASQPNAHLALALARHLRQ